MFMLKKTKCSLLLVVCAIVFSCNEEPSPGPGPVPVPEPTQLEGIWAGFNSNGIDFTRWTYRMNKDSISIMADSVPSLRGTFTLDTMANPTTIDVAIAWSAQPQDIGKKWYGVYLLSANILYISANPVGTARPGSTDTGATISLTLVAHHGIGLKEAF